jgi:hypothetical protein
MLSDCDPWAEPGQSRELSCGVLVIQGSNLLGVVVSDVCRGRVVG